MKIQYKGLLMTLSVITLVQLGGCYAMTVPIYTSIFAPQAEGNVEKLQATHDSLVKRYETKKEDIIASIAKQKKGITQSIGEGDIQKGLSQINELYIFTHPCGEDECKLDKDGKPKSTSYGRDYIIRKEDIGTENDFIESKTTKAYSMVEDMLKSSRFGDVETALIDVDKKVSYDKNERSKFVKLKKDLRGQWLKTLLSQAKSQEKSYPGLALLKYYKASSIAGEIGDSAKSNDIKKKADAFRRTVWSQNSLSIVINASGSLAGPAVRSLMEIKPAGVQYVRSRTSSTKSNLTIQTKQPQYAITKEGKTGSFEYVSGTKKVTNPEVKKIKKRLAIANDNYRCLNDICGDDYKYCIVNRFSGSSIKIGGKGSQNPDACGPATSWKSHADEQRALLSSAPSQITIETRSNRSYPYTLHKHTGRVSSSHKLSAVGIRPVGKQYTEVAVLTDKEHKAYSEYKGSVSADRKEVPTVKAVFDEMARKMAIEINKTTKSVLATYLNNLKAKGGVDSDKSKAQRSNGLSLYVLVSNKHLDKKSALQLDTISGIPNAQSFIKSSTDKKRR